MYLEDVRYLAAELNDVIYSTRGNFSVEYLKNELEGIIIRRSLTLHIDQIREAISANKVLYEVTFKGIRHRLHIPKQDTPLEDYQNLVRKLWEEFFESKVAKRYYLLDVPKKWLLLLEEDGNDLARGYCEVVRYTTDLFEEYKRCKQCVEKALNRKPQKGDWEIVLKSVDEDEALKPFMERCMVPCELIDLVAEVESKFNLQLDTELEKAYNSVFS
ncbi:MAG: hypothetical protein DSZ25_00375 [Thermovibrio sp.]|nr:MAG: hypothetical protein DSZ25_00375 [Thermovibrio sp.]